MPDTLPRTSLIVCSRNRPQLLCELIRSVLDGDELPTEIVVVDDSDEPNARLHEWAGPAGCEIRYIWAHGRGLSRANNDGIAAARHALLVFTQDDVRVARDWFGTLVRALVAAGPRTIVTGQVPPEAHDGAERFAPSTREDSQPRTYEGRVGEGIAYVQNMALYRCVHTALGGFDKRLGPGTRYPSAEDNDFVYRALSAGYRVVYCPQAVVYHRAWRGAEELVPLRWNYGLGRGAAYAKHVTPHDRFMLRQMAWDVRVHLVGAAVRVRRERERALGDLALALGIVCGALLWWTGQRH